MKQMIWTKVALAFALAVGLACAQGNDLAVAASTESGKQTKLAQDLQTCAEQWLQQAPGHVGIVVSDASDGTILYHNSESGVQVPSASMIKVLVMSRIFERIAAGELSGEQMIRIPKEDKIPGGIVYELEVSEYSLNDLLTLMITLSDNTATNMLIDLAGYEETNRLGKELGLSQTALQRKMLDFAAARAGRQNYSSADDMNKLFLLLAQQQVVNPSASEAMVNILKRQQDNHSFKRYLHEDLVVAHKSGWLDNLEHESGIFYTDNGNYVVTIFTWECEEGNGVARDFIGHLTLDFLRILSAKESNVQP